MLFTSFLLHLLVAALFFALPTAVCRNGNMACGGLNLRIGILAQTRLAAALMREANADAHRRAPRLRASICIRYDVCIGVG